MVTTVRTRIETADGDFLDLDAATGGHPRVAIISHGLEGSSRQSYVQGMARALYRKGWDVVAWNFRGCSGEPNRLLRFYHSGATEDLREVIEHVSALGRYERIALIGFSLGGNLTLKFIGECGDRLPRLLSGAVVYSVPCDLAGSARRLAERGNAIYLWRFLRMLIAKVRAKHALYPGDLDVRELDSIRTFGDFDGRFTAPLHGFVDAEDYWRRCSSLQFLDRIRTRTLLVNAWNDPFLCPSCFPILEAGASKWLHFEAPRSGGHVGFVTFGQGGDYWSERRAVEFLG